MIINNFVSALQEKNYEALADCFAKDCRYEDYCPAQVKQNNIHLYGRNTIEMAFHNKFVFGLFSLRNSEIIDERTVSFFADYGGSLVHAVARIESCTDDSFSDENCLITKLVVRPA